MTTTSDLLLGYAARITDDRPGGLTMSRLGGCERQAGYIVNNVEPSDRGESIQGAIGNAIHDAIEREARARGIAVETRVTFAGMSGAYDRYEEDTATVGDTKTCYNRIDKVKRFGPLRRELWQINALAAGVVASGLPVRNVRIDYLDRASGDEWTWEGRPDPAVLRDALTWVRMVRTTPLDMLPRAFAPESNACAHCPFRTLCWEGGVEGRKPESVLFVEDPDAAKWARQYVEAKLIRQDAEKAEKQAKNALDALRPSDDYKVTVDVDGVVLRWSWRNGKRSPDMDEIAARYEQLDEPVPYKQGAGYYLLDADLPASDIDDMSS